MTSSRYHTGLLKLVADATSNKQIGQEPRIIQATAKSHLSHIFGKLGSMTGPLPSLSR